MGSSTAVLGLNIPMMKEILSKFSVTLCPTLSLQTPFMAKYSTQIQPFLHIVCVCVCTDNMSKHILQSHININSSIKDDQIYRKNKNNGNYG